MGERTSVVNKSGEQERSERGAAFLAGRLFLELHGMAGSLDSMALFRTQDDRLKLEEMRERVTPPLVPAQRTPEAL